MNMTTLDGQCSVVTAPGWIVRLLNVRLLPIVHLTRFWRGMRRSPSENHWGTTRSIASAAVLAGLVVVGSGFTLTAMTGCDRDDAPSDGVRIASSEQSTGEQEGSAVSRESRDGVVVARIDVARDIVSTAERVNLSISVSAPEGHIVEAPDIEAALPEGWSIASRDRASQVERGRSIQRYEYELTPFLPGEFEIGAIAIRHRAAEGPVADDVSDANTGNDAGANDEGAAGDERIVETAPFVIEVTSVLPPGDPGAVPAELRGVLDPPPERMPAWVWLAGAAAIVALLAAAMVLRRVAARRAASRAAEALPPHVIALRALDELERLNLPGQNLYKPFYQTATDIMRRYIEARFNVDAPDRTTEEFLYESRASGRFAGEDLVLFERFLSHCDMVKFAEFQPTRAEADATIRTVRDFVERTRAAAAPTTAIESQGREGSERANTGRLSSVERAAPPAEQGAGR